MLLSRYYALPGKRDSRLGVWGGALILHLGVALGLTLGWPDANAFLEKARKSVPVEVRLLQPEQPPKPLPPPRKLPPPPKAPPPQIPQQVPPPQVAMAPPPQLIATTAVGLAPTFVAPPVSNEPVPVSHSAVAAGPVQAGPPVQQAAAPEPLVEARFDADYLSNPKPAYPMASRRLGEAGVVHLRVQVGSDGRALRVELKNSSGFARLDEAAKETVARWNFVPARRGATTVVSWVVVPIIFSMN